MIINVDALSLVGSFWRDKKYFLRQLAIKNAAPEFCLSAPSFELAMDWIFAHWTEENIRKLIKKFPLPPFFLRRESSFKNPIQILSGTTPAMIAQGFLQGALLALLNIPQCIKLPHQQTTFAYLLHQSFQEHTPKIGALFSLDDGQNLPLFHEKLKTADWVIAYGHDETMATIHRHLSPDATFIAHGHAESAAIIFKEFANLASLEKLAYDMLSYDQRGCLSPRVTFIEEGGELSPAECVQQFAEIILPALAQQLPRGGLFPGEAEEILHQRMLYQFRGNVYLGSDWTVCYDDGLVWPTVSLPRFMPFKFFNNINQIERCCPHLICVGYAGNSEQAQCIKKFTSRLCALGNMQKQCLLF